MVNSSFAFMRPSSLLGLFLLAISSLARAEAPNIILITVDTTRADRMGFLGSTRGLTPNLDIIAKQGVVFEQTFSQAPLTPVSHATIFTGTYPQFHTVSDFGQVLHMDAIDGMRVFLRALLAFGIKPDEVKIMLKDNPAKLMWLDE